MKVFFSVVIPLYNKERNVADTINSVLEQSYTHFELIVVNDGSTDRGVDIVKAFQDRRIRLFETENHGVSSARNYGVEKANGEYIVFIDADDLWYSSHLSDLEFLISKFPEGKWFATAYEMLHNDRLTLPMRSPIMQRSHSWYGRINDFFKYSMEDCLVWTSAVCMRKDFFLQLGGFNVLYDTGQDVDLWIRAALSAEIYFTNKISACYMLTASNRLSLWPTKQKRHMDVDAFLAEEEDNISFKRYMNLIRFYYSIKFKIAGDMSTYLRLKAAIDTKQLTFFQKILLNIDGSILKLMKWIKKKWECLGIRIRVPKKYVK
ncbi:glycosyltransferase family 2 protein [Saccharicrinis fermentans]|uniref:Poly-beta-1,6-N-acetyl-D-glucosamine synthase n=1 Tax=Saccharicrinis fermentans DSM 9555 = JCM 21142 TaxID=869213 RepID=W7Y5M1_9BACT|nr:glycosyltransferase family A protein [Saccharicrinis fermentans]GAF03417.1 poly-beta-1,6-N-acetyl-D-glucosamine synthase [Saccharicrinis fermentans DSM 9555 = JCM 21142]